jgi:hypothetical protein
MYEITGMIDDWKMFAMELLGLSVLRCCQREQGNFQSL